MSTVEIMQISKIVPKSRVFDSCTRYDWSICLQSWEVTRVQHPYPGVPPVPLAEPWVGHSSRKRSIFLFDHLDGWAWVSFGPNFRSGLHLSFLLCFLLGYLSFCSTPALVFAPTSSLSFCSASVLAFVSPSSLTFCSESDLNVTSVSPLLSVQHHL